MTVVPDEARDLTEQPVAVLATIGPDRRPQVSAVWFLFEDDRFRVSLNTTRQKTKNLRTDRGVTLFVLQPDGRRYLEVRGDAVIEPDDDYEFADRLGAKYGGADLRVMDGPGESRVAVAIEPSRINHVDMTGGAGR